MSWIRLATAQALDIIEALVRDVEEVECFFGSDRYVKLRPTSDEEESQQVTELIGLSEHCARLSDLSPLWHI